MTFSEVLSAYLVLNALVVVAYALSLMTKSVSWRDQLKLNYFFIGTILIIAVFSTLLPKSDYFEPVAKVWASHSVKQNFWGDYSLEKNAGYISFTPISDEKMVQTQVVSNIWSLLGWITFLVGLIFLIRDLKTLARIRKQSYLIRKVGRVHILLNQELRVPYSYWHPGKSFVVIPTSLLSQRENYKIAVQHELQHHRQKDTRFIYVLWLIKIFCVVNPFVHLWFRKVSEVQEFACDETLVDQKKVDSRAYASCLLQVAQSAVKQKFNPACATGLTFLIGRFILKRRIEQMFNQKTKLSQKWSFVIALVALCGFYGTAFALNGMVEDRRITLDHAQEMAKIAEAKIVKSGSDFPIVMNEQVLQQLNRALGTPQGREYIRKTLARMRQYKPMIEQKLQAYGAPKELMAVPVVESGYRNIEQVPGKNYGAGLWMFIQQTARAYGLVVNEQQDDRLNPVLETDAAIRLLTADRLRFQDWQLALLGYNAGEKAVQNALDSCKLVQAKCGAWELLARGLKTDKDYLPKVMAAVIVLKNEISFE